MNENNELCPLNSILPKKNEDLQITQRKNDITSEIKNDYKKNVAKDTKGRKIRIKHLISFTEEQEEIIIGSLLGDGSLKKPKDKNSSFRKGQKTTNKEYLDWISQKMFPFSSGVKSITNKSKAKWNKEAGKSYRVKCDAFHDGYEFSSRNHKLFADLEREWYKRDENGNYVFKKVGKSQHRIKILPSNIQLTPLIIAIWFCDDGCNNFRSNQIILCTDGFQEKEVLILKDKLNSFGFSSLIKRTKHGHRIVLNEKDYLSFIKLVTPYIAWECLKYKIDLSCYIDEKNSSKPSNVKGVTWNDHINKWIVYENKINRKILGYFTDFNKAVKEKMKYV